MMGGLKEEEEEEEKEEENDEGSFFSRWSRIIYKNSLFRCLSREYPLSTIARECLGVLVCEFSRSSRENLHGSSAREGELLYPLVGDEVNSKRHAEVDGDTKYG